jgi:hypothetical protein
VSIASYLFPPLLRAMATPLVKVLKWGIFDIAYEVPARSLSSRGPIHSVLSIFRWSSVYGHVWRLFKDVFRVAPVTFSAYIASSIWLGISPAVSLLLSHGIIKKVGPIFSSEVISQPNVDGGFVKQPKQRTSSVDITSRTHVRDLCSLVFCALIGDH